MPTIPALIVHTTSTRTAATSSCPIGTGPFELVSYDVGKGRSSKRRENSKWWDGEAYLDGIEFIDYGTDPAAMVSAFEAGEVDTNYETSADYVVDPRRHGPGQVGGRHRRDHRRRTNVNNKPYDDQKVRKALQLAVDNAVVLQLGYGDAGTVGGEPPCLPDPSRNISSCRRSRAISRRPRR